MKEGQVLGFYKVSQKEKTYYAIRLIISLAFYLGIILGYFFYLSDTVNELLNKAIILVPIIILVLLIYTIKNGVFVGFIKVFSIKINENQLPEIYRIAESISGSLGISKTPNVYLLQAGGSLNAFAKKFFNSNYIVIYSDLLDAYYEGDEDAVEFVIAHELGHIKRHHFFKELLLAPSILIPFLPQAYYRACELTCDNIGSFYNKKGAINGLLMLAGGKSIYRFLNLKEYVQQANFDASFWRWFTEKFLSHPSLFKRLINVIDSSELPNQIVPKQKPDQQHYIAKKQVENLKIEPEIAKPADKDSHERYMPQ